MLDSAAAFQASPAAARVALVLLQLQLPIATKSAREYAGQCMVWLARKDQEDQPDPGDFREPEGREGLQDPKVIAITKSRHVGIADEMFELNGDLPMTHAKSVTLSRP